MDMCIYCGKSDNKICDLCLEKVKKGEFFSLFSLKNEDMVTIVDACIPSPASNDVASYIQLPKKNEITIEKSSSEIAVVEEEAKSTLEAPVNSKITYGELIKENHKQKKKGRWGWRIAVAVLIGLTVSVMLLPWNIGQWMVGVPISILMIFCFFIFGLASSSTKAFIAFDIVLYVLTTLNIIFMNIWKIGYSTIGFIFIIALAVSSLCVMINAYVEGKKTKGHWALLCSVVNVVLIFWDKLYFYIEQLFSFIGRNF